MDAGKYIDMMIGDDRKREWRESSEDEEEAEAVVSTYLALCQRLLVRYGRDRSSTTHALHPGIHVSEIAAQFYARDNSYLHVVLHWQEREELYPATLTLLIHEHDPEGIFLKGSTYEINQGSLQRTDISADPFMERRYDFSMVRLTGELKEVAADSDRYKRATEEIDQQLTNREFEYSLGINGHPVRSDEMTMVSMVFDYLMTEKDG